MLVPLLLVGCWDERLYKNSSVVSLTGFEGEIGDVTAYYAYPQATTEEMKMIVIVGQGMSPRDVRQNADLKVEQILDLSELSTVLISEKTAKDDIYEYLDVYFRDSFNPITPKLAIIQGDLKPFFDFTEEMQSSTGEFYNRFITSLEENSMVIPYTLQTAGSLLFEQAQDLSLPYIKMDEEDRPIGNGVALFSGRSFTGETLSADQGVLLNILNKSLGHVARITTLYEGSPFSVRINKVKRNFTISESEIEIALKIEVVVTEFPQDHLKEKQIRTDLEQFLTKKMEKDMNEVIEKLQKAKSDAIGLGRRVRAFHPSLYKEDWSEHFSTLKIPVKVEVEIVKSGILY
ncbi:Ger(x)C family spore germination protein [Lysinibacillus sp. 2017]|uniref:Ger(x)C family spore germination protein n=1 Tax=unclassified Lysinibacillus TaxID=2636778 RepID=UPI000D5267AE|nr:MULTISPECIES: Ger(x)C family spore germination protein [unclassified Lysinibacillus]AWE08517.1 Ger(x)C family spore germination protein [Lysinibacillus sp. 2017]TGN35610.1 Ger(x)C family spore germination protein [Lysinibacillus sp. S2017]